MLYIKHHRSLRPKLSKLFGNLLVTNVYDYRNGVMEILKSATFVIVIYRLIILDLCLATRWSKSIKECPDGEVINATTEGTLILKFPRDSRVGEKTWVYCTSDKEGNKY